MHCGSAHSRSALLAPSGKFALDAVQVWVMGCETRPHAQSSCWMLPILQTRVTLNQRQQPTCLTVCRSASYRANSISRPPEGILALPSVLLSATKCFSWLNFEQCESSCFFLFSQGVTAGVRATVLYDGVVISAPWTHTRPWIFSFWINVFIIKPVLTQFPSETFLANLTVLLTYTCQHWLKLMGLELQDSYI